MFCVYNLHSFDFILHYRCEVLFHLDPVALRFGYVLDGTMELNFDVLPANYKFQAKVDRTGEISMLHKISKLR